MCRSKVNLQEDGQYERDFRIAIARVEKWQNTANDNPLELRFLVVESNGHRLAEAGKK
jgi:hypothetical protein